MSVWSKIVGIITSTFQVGLGGPLWNANGGALEAKNATNSAFAIGRGLAPGGGANDWVPLGNAPTVIYDPTAGANTGNTYNTLEGALAALSVYEGADTTILVAPNGGAPVMTGVPHNFKGVALTGLPGLLTPPTLTVQNGATITAGNGWRDIRYLKVSSTGAGVVQALTNGQQVPVGVGATLIAPGSPMFSIASGAVCFAIALGPSATLGDGANPVFVGLGAAGSATLGVNLGDGCTCSADVASAVTLSVASSPASEPAGVQTDATASANAVKNPFARAWTQTTVELDDFATLHAVLVSLNVTPGATGKFRVTIAPGLVATGAGGGNDLNFGISHGAGNPADDYTSTFTQVVGSESNAIAPTQVIDLDKVPAPVIYPVGVAVQINLTLTMTVDGATGASIAEGLIFEVQEVP
jgi:hypothetical protein